MTHKPRQHGTRFLCLDPGINNLGVCVMDLSYSGKEIVMIYLDNINIKKTPESKISNLILFFQPHYVLVEQQPARQKDAIKKILWFLKGYLFETSVILRTCKPCYYGKKTTSYRQRKNNSIRDFKIFMRWYQLDYDFSQHQKLDDIADAFNMCVREIIAFALTKSKN